MYAQSQAVTEVTPGVRAERPSGRSLSVAGLLDLQSLAGNAAVSRILAPDVTRHAVVVQRTGDPPASSSGEQSGRKQPRTEEPDEAKENEEQEDDREHFFSSGRMAKDVLTALVGLPPDPRPDAPMIGYKPGPQDPASPTKGEGWSISGSIGTAFSTGHNTRLYAIGGELASIYRGAGKDSLITEPKSYKELPDQQVLRWMSTVVYLYLRAVQKIPAANIQEVQATIHDGSIHISTNYDAANSSLRKVVGAVPSSAMFGQLIDALRKRQPELELEVAEDEAAEKVEAAARDASGAKRKGTGRGKGKGSTPDTVEDSAPDAAQPETAEEKKKEKEKKKELDKRRETATLLDDLRAPRSMWHIAQLEAWLGADPSVRRGEKVRDGLGNSVSVPSERHGGNNLHAERRLAESLGRETLDPAFVGGLKRPCVFCTIHLYAGKDVHPGPYWASQSAAMLANDERFRDIFVKAKAAYGAEDSASARKKQVAVAAELAGAIAKLVPRTYASAPTSGTRPDTSNNTDSEGEYDLREDTKTLSSMNLPPRNSRRAGSGASDQATPRAKRRRTQKQRTAGAKRRRTDTQAFH